MSKYTNFKEALEDMKATVDNGKVKLNRFNKKKFADLLTALANDTAFTTQVAKSVNGGTEFTVEEIAVTKEFRKWLKKQVEKCGVDKMESEKILTDEFVIDDMNPFYDFFTTAMIEYMHPDRISKQLFLQRRWKRNLLLKMLTHRVKKMRDSSSELSPLITVSIWK